MYSQNGANYNFPVNPMMGNVNMYEDKPQGLLGGFDNQQVMGLLGASAALLDASGPSRVPVSLGQALGRGVMGGLHGYQSGLNMQNEREKMRILAQKAQQELRGGVPYFQFLPTSQGYAVGDTRTGHIIPPGQGGIPNLMRDTADPLLRARLTAAEEREKAMYALRTGVDQATGAETTGPKVPGAIPTLPTKLGPGQEKQLSSQAEADVKRSADAGAKSRTFNQMNEAIKQAESILNDAKKTPTQSGVGSAYDTAAAFWGSSTEGAKQAAKLSTLSGWMTANVPRMEGPQSDKDTEMYKQMAASVGDKTKPVAERLAALETLKLLQSKYSGINESYRNQGSSSPNTSGGWSATPRN